MTNQQEAKIIMDTAITVATPPPSPVEAGTAALMRLIERAATDSSFDVAKLEALFTMKERWDANEARKAFVVAKAAFKGAVPKIEKNKHVGFASKDSNKASTDYWHATLDNIEETVSPVLSEYGLVYAWDVNQDLNNGGRITVSCILTHVMGHSEKVTLSGSPDSTGNKNNIQAVGSTVTYLERYTLLSILGMSTGDMDDDAKAAAEGLNGRYISADEKDELIGLIKDTSTDTAKFLKTLELGGSLDRIPATRLADARNALLTKKKAQEKRVQS